MKSSKVAVTLMLGAFVASACSPQSRFRTPVGEANVKVDGKKPVAPIAEAASQPKVSISGATQPSDIKEPADDTSKALLKTIKAVHATIFRSTEDSKTIFLEVVISEKEKYKLTSIIPSGETIPSEKTDNQFKQVPPASDNPDEIKDFSSLTTVKCVEVDCANIVVDLSLANKQKNSEGHIDVRINNVTTKSIRSPILNKTDGSFPAESSDILSSVRTVQMATVFLGGVKQDLTYTLLDESGVIVLQVAGNNNKASQKMHIINGSLSDQLSSADLNFTSSGEPQLLTLTAKNSDASAKVQTVTIELLKSQQATVTSTPTPVDPSASVTVPEVVTNAPRDVVPDEAPPAANQSKSDVATPKSVTPGK